MKMTIISFNEAIDADVTSALEAAGMRGFTRFKAVDGRGKSSGFHDGTEVWPGLNNVLMAVVPDDVAGKMLSAVRRLRETLGTEGVKAFMLPVEDAT